MPKGIGNTIFKMITSVPSIHRWMNRKFLSHYADSGPLPGVYTTRNAGKTSLWEMLHKEHFALEVPPMSEEEQADLPNIDEVMALFHREGPADESRVTMLLPLFAQHLTDAVFQSDGSYGTDAPHEIILNQIYGNTADDSAMLRSHRGGKLRSQMRACTGGDAEFPDALMEKSDDVWQVKPHYSQLSYLQKKGNLQTLLASYAGHEDAICATGLFQGNLTLGNFAITTLLLREHNRLCDGIREEFERTGTPADDDTIFRTAQQCNITTYMKVVLEDYINAIAGQKLFCLDTDSFFHEKKRWCRETPIPYHFNILYRLHCLMPDRLAGFESGGFDVLRANNPFVFKYGVGAVLQAASAQGAGKIRLGNTPTELINADKAGVMKARRMLGSFNAHRRAQGMSGVGFSAFDPRYREQLRALYGNDPEKVEYAVGILAELPQTGWMEKLGIKDDPIMGETLMNAIAKHAFRHILSNRFMTREYLNPEVMTRFGWQNLKATSTVADLVSRNMAGEMNHADAKSLRITFANTH